MEGMDHMKQMTQMTRNEPKINLPAELTPLSEVEHQLEDFIRGVNESTPPTKEPREITHFEKLGSELSSALIAAHQDLVNEVHNKLEEIKTWAEKINQEIKVKALEHERLTERVRNFGASLLDAHNRFHSK
jgi:uncharacterized coiled-coil DUF342 family protein